MGTRTPAEQSLDAHERLISQFRVRSKIDKDSLHHISFSGSGARPPLREWWVVQYVLKFYSRLAFDGKPFTAVKGPFEVGPDLNVKHNGKWHPAEVELSWHNYFEHGHDKSKAFAACRFLIVLSDKKPSGPKAGKLPSCIVYIDQEHFAEWQDKAAAEYARTHQPASKLNARLNVVAGNMQAAWVEVCSDKDRPMATCPDCNSCAYFGDGTAGEASLKFQQLARMFAEKYCTRRTKDAGSYLDLSKISEAKLREFIAMCGL